MIMFMVSPTLVVTSELAIKILFYSTFALFFLDVWLCNACVVEILKFQDSCQLNRTSANRPFTSGKDRNVMLFCRANYINLSFFQGTRKAIDGKENRLSTIVGSFFYPLIEKFGW